MSSERQKGFAERFALLFIEQAIGDECPGCWAVIDDPLHFGYAEFHAGELLSKRLHSFEHGLFDLCLGLEGLVPVGGLVFGVASVFAFAGGVFHLVEQTKLAVHAHHEGDFIPHLGAQAFQQFGIAFEQLQRLVGLIVAVDVAPPVGEVLRDPPFGLGAVRLFPTSRTRAKGSSL
ncbi:hypothetical protein C6571_18130 (plasmid) [Simplicispira suum]|uniref:Uncharacterized protein n=1 Tax=Simplicispira suum TaxID=2109915 RepID=A0A2S0N5C8_9BURK|nr:hypothetical protein C6571_18130 [Simplicispira suum]